jgi:hypothetical protein
MTDIDLNDELEKLLKTLTKEEAEATKRHESLHSYFYAIYGQAIYLPADPCLRVVTQFMEGVEEDA